MREKLTTRAFIEKARTVHGERYGYEQVDCQGSKQPVVIQCFEHGEFRQVAYSHFSGNGCPRCGQAIITAKNTKNTSSFIEEARAAHGGKYDYSLTEYTGTHKPVFIICPEHGEFQQRPRDHIGSAYGCRKCGHSATSSALTNSSISFLETARTVHGDKYDYSLANYTAARHKVQIICPEHGEFSQVADVHLAGMGCAKCGELRSAAAKRGSIDTFLKNARAKHGDTYDYSLVVYKRALDKVRIVCPKHGEFLQSASSHTSGIGCPACGLGKGGGAGWRRSAWVASQKGRKATLYIIFLEGKEEAFFKIGITFQSISKRFSKRMPYRFTTVALFRNYDAERIYDLETALHKALKSYQHKPILTFGGETECFSSIQPALNLLPPETFFLKNRPIK